MFAELSDSVRTALETYSNVHRGTGHNSLVSTHLYERARGIVLDHLGLARTGHTVVFCSPRQADLLRARVGPGNCRVVSSRDLGLPLGLRAVAVRRRALPAGAPAQPGGGTARLVGPGWVVWARAPERFETGTPAVVNAIALARVLELAKDALPAEEATAEDILYHDQLEKYRGEELLAELRGTLIGQRVPVPTRDGTRPFVNLDNAASTPTFEPVWEAVQQAWRQPDHVRRDIVREAKAICAGVLGAPATRYDVIFTSNTTEAINLVAESLRKESGTGVSPVVVNTILEHNSNDLPWRTLPGVTPVRLSVDAEGFVDPTELETLLRSYNQQHGHGTERIRLVAVSGASNVLGACNDLAEIGRIAHRYGALLLVDAAQLVAHRTVEMDAWGIDYLAFSAHKTYAPFGTGALVARKGLLHFDAAEAEAIRASGEENVGGIAALGKALVLLRRIGWDVIQQEEQALTARALYGLAKIPGLTLYGVQDPDSPHFGSRTGAIVFSLEKTMAGRVAAELAERGGIGVRSGCHCAHLLIKHLLGISQPLQRFQRFIVTVFPRLELPGLARISLGIENTPEDIDTLLEVLGRIAAQPGAGDDRPARDRRQVRREMRAFARAAADRVYG